MWNKITFGIVVIAVLVAIFVKPVILASNILFIFGIICVLAAVCVILADSKLFMGFWIRKQKRNSDWIDSKLEQEDKDLRKIASRKNEPIRFKPVTRFLLVIGVLTIALSIIITLV